MLSPGEHRVGKERERKREMKRRTKKGGGGVMVFGFSYTKVLCATLH